ncbi:MAG: J domain-containing protein [Terracidiphilus sp.]
MDNHFNQYRGYDTAMQRNRETVEAPTSNLSGSYQSGQASPFISDFQQLLGETSEPDPLFFIETWTLGTPAAVENFRQRQPMQVANRNTQTQADQQAAYVSTQSFFHPNPFNWSVFTSVHTVAPDPTSQQPSTFSTTPTSDNVSNDDDSLPMTLDRACRILRVTSTSPLSQIKTAHRQLVIEWHPDRLQNQTEEVRRYATGKMAAINEAYSLLRNDLLQHSA